MAFIKRNYTDEETLITAQNLNDIQDSILELEAGLFSMDNEQRGVSVKVDNAATRGLISLKLYGKTTQGGTPTPEAPVDLVSAAENNIAIHVSGKNLFKGWIVGGVASGDGSDETSADKRRTEYIPISAPGQYYYVSGIPDTLYNFAAYYDGNKKFISRSPAGAYSNRLFTPPENAKYFRLVVYISSATSGVIAEADVMANVTMIEAGNAATGYEAWKEIQTATIEGFNGLRGFPVSSGGNYTDANGQQWVCDEIDLRRRVHIQRIGQVTLNGSESWLGYLVTEINQFHTAIPSIHKENERGAMCKYYRPITIRERSLKYGTIYTYNGGIAINTQECATVQEWKTFLSTRPITVLYVLDKPIETPLSEEDLAEYNSLHTYRNNTTVSNSGHAFMELEYVMDAKKYIDGLQTKAGAGRIVNVNLPAAKWTGTGSLYSQVVSISGVTENSQVNLTPTVSQMSIFYEKDITFITENDGGVITVYVIGQKPQNDYTIPANIVEVRV